MSKFNKKSKLPAVKAVSQPTTTSAPITKVEAKPQLEAKVPALASAAPQPAVPAKLATTPPLQPPAAGRTTTTPITGNRVSIELVKPDAKQVFVAGSFNGWRPEATPLTPAGNGRWVGNLNVTPGRYEYLFVVDGQWLPDPKAKEVVQNPYGGNNSVLVVR